MKPLYVACVLTLALGACQTATTETTSVAPAVGAQSQALGSFVGTWTGTTERGGSVRIEVPATGRPTYVFRGTPVAVSDARMIGDALAITTSGGATITLAPAGRDRVRYSFVWGDQTASAVLSRS